jgi:hypothetical protein
MKNPRGSPEMPWKRWNFEDVGVLEVLEYLRDETVPNQLLGQYGPLYGIYKIVCKLCA